MRGLDSSDRKNRSTRLRALEAACMLCFPVADGSTSPVTDVANAVASILDFSVERL